MLWLANWITRERSAIWRYGYAVGFAAAALLLNKPLGDVTDRNLFFLLTTAIVLSSVLAGYGAGVITTLLSAVGMNIFYLDPRPGTAEVRESFIRILAFLVTGGLLLFLGGLLRDSLRRAQRLQKEAEDAVRARDEFLSVVTHELKNPLTSLKMQAQLSLRQFQSSNPAAYLTKESFERSHKLTTSMVNKMQQLLDDLSDLSRVSFGKLKIDRQKTDAAAIVGSVAESFSAEAEKKGIALKLNLAGDLTGHWDPMRLDQVVTNLISNAIKYGESKPIEVSGSMKAGAVVISVKDQGMGISRENLETIFERFERANESKRIKGLGLGLYITKHIVEAHGGKIWAESNLRKGSTFFVELPKG